MIRFFVLMSGAYALLWASSALAATFEFLVTDQNGEALPDAVIELVSDKPPSATTDDLFVMDQVGKAFSPRVLVVPAGANVSFPNSDNIRHHVYSFSAARAFELKLYSGQPKAPVTFAQSGVVVLGCNIHDAMVGYIYVANSPWVATSNSQGSARIANAPGSTAKFNVWHPEQIAGSEQRQALELSAASDKTINVVIETLTPAPRNTFLQLLENGQ